MPPKFRSCECQRIYPDGHEDWFRSQKLPGAFYWSEETWGGNTWRVLWIHLPYDPPERSHAWSSLRVYREGEPVPPAPAWQWDGNEDQPTLNPSISTMRIPGKVAWHGYLKAGKLEACAS